MARILVVDDDPDILEALELALSGRHEVVPARDGLDALERFDAAARFDLVLLDLMMPRMSGGELVRALHARGVEVPVIIASAAHDVRAQAAELGVRDYLAKPFSLKALRAKIAGVLAPGGGGGAHGSGGAGGPLESEHEPALRAAHRSVLGRAADCSRASRRDTRAPWQSKRRRSNSRSSSSWTGRTSRRPSTRTALRS